MHAFLNTLIVQEPGRSGAFKSGGKTAAIPTSPSPFMAPTPPACHQGRRHSTSRSAKRCRDMGRSGEPDKFLSLLSCRCTAPGTFHLAEADDRCGDIFHPLGWGPRRRRASSKGVPEGCKAPGWWPHARPLGRASPCPARPQVSSDSGSPGAVVYRLDGCAPETGCVPQPRPLSSSGTLGEGYASLCPQPS